MKKRTFDTTKEAIGRVYETTCCSRRSPTLCLFVDIAWNDSKTRWRKNKRKRGDQPSVPTPSFDLSRLSFSSTSCTPSLSLPCLLFALDLDPRRRWRRHVDWRDFYAAFVEEGGGGGEGNLSSFGFQTSAKNVKNNFSFGFFWWIKIIGDVFSRLLIFENWKFFDHLFWGGGEEFRLILGDKWKDIIDGTFALELRLGFEYLFIILRSIE